MEETIERLSHKFTLLDSNDKKKKKEIDNILKILAVKHDKAGKLQQKKEELNI